MKIENSADFILKNARVITLDPAAPGADFVAVRGGRILCAGASKELDSLIVPTTKIIDCAGKTVVPGFNDAHSHIHSFVRQILSLDISPSAAKSIEGIKAAIFQKTQETPRGEWIAAAGYYDFYLTEKRHPTRRDLDAVSPDHPVVLFHRSLHACVLNSRALALAGIGNETEEPPGATIDRFLDTGEPSGLLFEMVGHVTNHVLPPLSDEKFEKGIALAGRHYLAQGITSLQDATVTNSLARWRQFLRMINGKILESRLFMLIGMENLMDFLEEGLIAGSGDANLKLGAVKFVLTDSGRGVLPSQEVLNWNVLAAHDAGFPVAIHAVQAESVAAAAGALEYVRERRPNSRWRHRIEHCSECPPALVERLKKLGAVIVTQPPFLYESGERYLAAVPADRQPWLYRIKSLMDSGLVVAGSSDSPVASDNPLLGICSAVTRKADTGLEVLPEERISANQALEMYTVNAAYASCEEDIKGSITPGKVADLVVLDADPLSVPSEQIKDIKVEMTVVGGEVVWER